MKTTINVEGRVLVGANLGAVVGSVLGLGVAVAAGKAVAATVAIPVIGFLAGVAAFVLVDELCASGGALVGAGIGLTVDVVDAELRRRQDQLTTGQAVTSGL